MKVNEALDTINAVTSNGTRITIATLDNVKLYTIDCRTFLDDGRVYGHAESNADAHTGNMFIFDRGGSVTLSVALAGEYVVYELFECDAEISVNMPVNKRITVKVTSDSLMWDDINGEYTLLSELKKQYCEQLTDGDIDERTSFAEWIDENVSMGMLTRLSK